MRFLLAFALSVALAPIVGAQTEVAAFEVHEATIAQIHAAMREGRVTCKGLVEAYLRRIDAYDKRGPAINSLVVTNPRAIDEAVELDRRFVAGGLTGPLHCVPMIVKDNFETVGLQSANGSLSLAGFVSHKDAFQVKRVKDAGAIVLAKSNMAEWAFTPYETVSSILPGYTRNPYALDRVTAGSSGGTAAAIAASLGAVGLGSDTGNSIRGPSSHQALVGIRSTMGLTSRGGVMPLAYLADIAGPMARTVEDAVAVFQVIVGEDPADPVTAAARNRPPQDYRAALVADGLKGARIGVLRQAYERESLDPEIAKIFMQAVGDLQRASAVIVDPATVPGLSEIRRPQGMGPCRGFKFDINEYLASHGDRVPVKSLAEIVKGGRFHPTVRARLEQAELGPANGPESAECQADTAYRDRMRAAVTELMDRERLDALVYPTWSNPPRLIGDLNTPHGDNSQLFSPATGFPAIQAPMGYSLGGRLPAGITFFGRAWSESTLIRLAYAYQQATRRRRSPAATPPLPPVLPPTVLKMDSLTAIAGHTPRVLGAPRVIDTPIGKAAAFDGVDDGLIVPANPLGGAAAFTIEILFRPDADGPAEQRFLHVEDDAGARALIETRLTTDGRWALDTFLMNGTNRLPLLDRALLHPTGEWAWAALRYDGSQMSSFVNGKKELEGPVMFAPMLKSGRTSLGVRLNEVYWFKGAIREVRFHTNAIPVEDLQRPASVRE